MVAADGPWSTKLLPIAKTRPFNQTMEALYELLSPVCCSLDIWETTYLYPVKGVGAIIDLMKATSLAPFLRPLSESLRRAFHERYEAELTRAYQTQRDGNALLRFPRIFVLARR
jgi:trans-aconitate 2-methyltransferase